MSTPRQSSSCIFAAAAMMLIATSPSTSQAPAPNGSPQWLAKSVGDLTAAEEEQFATAAEGTLERVCIACHPYENITKTRRTPREWDDQVTAMAQRGAPGSEPDFTLVRKYLTRYYGIVKVNSATAEELAAVLGFPLKVAQAVVEYRTANGRFVDLASLEKVPGVDKGKLAEQAGSIRFD